MENRQKERAHKIPVVNLDEEPVVKSVEEVLHLKKQIDLIQERLKNRNKIAEKVLEGKRKITKDREIDSEEQSVQGYTDCSPGRREKICKKERGNPFTREVLEDHFLSHFKPVNYEYDGTSEPEDHVVMFENVTLLH